MEILFLGTSGMVPTKDRNHSSFLISYPSEKVLVDCEVKIHDKEGNHISTGSVKWQIKSWKKVKTKI